MVQADGTRRLEPMRWGLIPCWAKDKTIGSQCINARSETVASKPSFRAAFKARRCLVPATGDYEWHQQPAGKQPYFITSEVPSRSRSLWCNRILRSRVLLRAIEMEVCVVRRLMSSNYTFERT